MSIKTMRNEMAEAARAAVAIQEKAIKEGRIELTADEQKEFDSFTATANDLQARIDRANGVNEAADRMRALGGPVRSEGPAGAATVAGTAGQQFVASDAFRNRTNRGGRFSTELVDIQAATFTSASGGSSLVQTQVLPGVVPVLFEIPTVASLYSQIPVTSSSVRIVQQSSAVNAAAEVADEGSTKPEATIAYAEVDEPVRTVAVMLPVSNQMLEDAPALAATIDQQLRAMVDARIDSQLLNGNGTSPNLEGVLNRSGLATTVTKGGSETYAEAVARQMFAIQNANPGIVADAVILNPADWQSIVLSKDANDRYFAGGPFISPQAQTLWGLRVATTSAIAVGTALVGAFRTAGQLYRRSTIAVQISDSHEDYFARNLQSIRAEARVGLGLLRTTAFGIVDLIP